MYVPFPAHTGPSRTHTHTYLYTYPYTPGVQGQIGQKATFGVLSQVRGYFRLTTAEVKRKTGKPGYRRSRRSGRCRPKTGLTWPPLSPADPRRAPPGVLATHAVATRPHRPQPWSNWSNADFQPVCAGQRHKPLTSGDDKKLSNTHTGRVASQLPKPWSNWSNGPVPCHLRSSDGVRGLTTGEVKMVPIVGERFGSVAGVAVKNISDSRKRTGQIPSSSYPCLRARTHTRVRAYTRGRAQARVQQVEVSAFSPKTRRRTATRRGQNPHRADPVRPIPMPARGRVRAFYACIVRTSRARGAKGSARYRRCVADPGRSSRRHPVHRAVQRAKGPAHRHFSAPPPAPMPGPGGR